MFLWEFLWELNTAMISWLRQHLGRVVCAPQDARQATGDRRPDLTRTPQQELDRRDALVVDSTCGGRVGDGEGADPPGSSGTLPAHERDVVERLSLCGEIAGAFASDPSTSAGTVLSGGGGGPKINNQQSCLVAIGTKQI